MKAFQILFTALVAVLLFPGSGLGAGETNTNGDFERLKALAGQWEGRSTEGKTVKATYKLVSAGSAVAETLEVAGEPDMLTVYHLDGNSVVMTHYCSLGNQPTMRAAAADPRELTFRYVSATNLAAPDADHMDDLVVRFEGPNHLTEEWTMKGKTHEHTVVFHLERKK
jgi:hypothetical protein